MKGGKEQKKKTHYLDVEVIEACMSYCELRAGLSAAFRADPDGNSAFAEKRADQVDKVAAGHLKTATKMQSITMLGLSAKARTALFMLKDDLHSLDIINPPERAFLLSLAADAKRMADAAEHERFRQRCAEEKVAKAA